VHSHPSTLHGDLHAFLALLRIQDEVEGSSADGSQLTQHDVLGDSSDIVHLTMGRCFHQHVNRLLKRAPHQRAHVLSVDAVTRDRHQMSSLRHDVAQKRQMAVVDIRPVE
jgi:hypothetical protein